MIWRLAWAHPEFGQIIATCSADRSVKIWSREPAVGPLCLCSRQLPTVPTWTVDFALDWFYPGVPYIGMLTHPLVISCFVCYTSTP
ncbi:unnamed protein product [Choristocarpus tenellus]